MKFPNHSNLGHRTNPRVYSRDTFPGLPGVVKDRLLDRAQAKRDRVNQLRRETWTGLRENQDVWQPLDAE